MQIQGRWQGRFGQVFSDLYPRSTTFASLHLRVFAFFSSNRPGSLREIHYLCVFAPSRLCVLFFQQALRAVLPLTPPPPTPPAKALGARGSQAVGG